MEAVEAPGAVEPVEASDPPSGRSGSLEPQKPADPIPPKHKEEPHYDVDPDWKMHKVTQGNKYTAGVYSLCIIVMSRSLIY